MSDAHSWRLAPRSTTMVAWAATGISAASLSSALLKLGWYMSRGTGLAAPLTLLVTKRTPWYFAVGCAGRATVVWTLPVACWASLSPGGGYLVSAAIVVFTTNGVVDSEQSLT